MILVDSEFGEIIVRRNALAKNISFSRSTSGRLQMSVPSFVSERQIQKSLDSMRDRLRGLNLADPATQRARDTQKKLLIKQAKEYLPYRLEYLARRYGYHYDKVTLKHQSTRWGSCTRRKKSLLGGYEFTISMNIGLMYVPEVLRDYLIIHELAHINHPDHSKAFWREVESHDPNYRAHREMLKKHNPGL